MKRSQQSGKIQLLKGMFQYLWEDLKNINRSKLKALRLMASGYLKMKLGNGKKPPIKKPREISLLER